MKKLIERLATAERALLSFGKLANLDHPSEIERDAAILRFKVSFEATCRVAKCYLCEVEGIVVESPKDIIRSSREVRLLEDTEAITAIEMVNDRNLTVHAYNEELAVKIHSNLPRYNKLLHQWMERIAYNMEGVN